MSTTFTASNGENISPETEDNVFRLGTFSMASREVVALREFFHHEAGVWIDPETKAVVMRLPHEDDGDGRCVGVIVPGWGTCTSWEKALPRGAKVGAITARYFAAHPEPKPWMSVADGVYAVSPQAHPYERLLQKRSGEWMHLYRSPSEGASEPHTAEVVAESAYKEQRLTRLLPEVTP